MKNPLSKFIYRFYQQLRLVCCLWLAQKVRCYSRAQCRLFLMLWITIIGLWSAYKILYPGSTGFDVPNQRGVKHDTKNETEKSNQSESSGMQDQKRIHDNNKR